MHALSRAKVEGHVSHKLLTGAIEVEVGDRCVAALLYRARCSFGTTVLTRAAVVLGDAQGHQRRLDRGHRADL